MRFRIPAVLALVATAIGCIDKAEVDANETSETLNTSPESQDYDPGNSIIPFPNNLLLDSATGLNDFPASCNESEASEQLRTEVLNTLDGAGTWLPVAYATFTSQVDLSSTDGHVFLIKKVADASEAVAVSAQIGRYQTVRYTDDSCSENSVVEGITIVPKVPLDDNATYVVGITQGVTNTDGVAFEPSSTWFLARQEEPVVTIVDANGDGVTTADEVVSNYTPLDQNDPTDEDGDGEPDVLTQLDGLQQLYQVNQTFLPFTNAALTALTGTDITREDILIAWAFNTQTVEVPLDPSATKGPASHVADAPITFGLTAVAHDDADDDDTNIANFIGTYVSPSVCAAAPCEKIATIYAGEYVAQNYQVPGPNTGVLTDPVPGPWESPIDPPEATGPVTLSVIATLPKGTAPAAGWPLVVFGHGLQSQKAASLVIAPALANAGIATIAVDWPLHGDRAVQIYPIGSGCESASDTTAAGDPANFNISPNCFAQILSTNLTATRDNFRQGVIDVMRLIESVKTCSGTAAEACAGFAIDAANIGYLGQSLGSLLGGMDVAMSPSIKAAVLNVPAVSLITIVENTDTNTIRCPIIDALIDNGTLTGKLWQQADGTYNETDALCIQTDTTKAVAFASDPTNSQYSAYQTFATAARWVLDPADTVNFIDRLGSRVGAGQLALLLQEVEGDTVLPNEATYYLGALLGFAAPVTAATPTSATPAATDGLSNTATVLSWLQYVTSATAAYAHASLLSPATTDPAQLGQLGTAQMQTDAVTFLATHLQSVDAAQLAK